MISDEWLETLADDVGATLQEIRETPLEDVSGRTSIAAMEWLFEDFPVEYSGFELVTGNDIPPGRAEEPGKWCTFYLRGTVHAEPHLQGPQEMSLSQVLTVPLFSLHSRNVDEEEPVNQRWGGYATLGAVVDRVNEVSTLMDDWRHPQPDEINIYMPKTKPGQLYTLLTAEGSDLREPDEPVDLGRICIPHNDNVNLVGRRGWSSDKDNQMPPLTAVVLFSSCGITAGDFGEADPAEALASLEKHFGRPTLRTGAQLEYAVDAGNISTYIVGEDGRKTLPNIARGRLLIRYQP